MDQSNASGGTTNVDPFDLVGDSLIEGVVAEVREYMKQYDGSHDYSHILRVVGNARHLADEYARNEGAAHGVRPLDRRLVTLAALLHDVGDHKYLPAEGTEAAPTDRRMALLDGTPLEGNRSAAAIAQVLFKCTDRVGAEISSATLLDILLICVNVSWSKETESAASGAFVAEVIESLPELAVVQDADRLDAIGAIGAARCFAFGARPTAKNPGGRPLASGLEHFDEKLVRIPERMKTTEGRRLAAERVMRLKQIQAWYRDEEQFAVRDSR